MDILEDNSNIYYIENLFIYLRKMLYHIIIVKNNTKKKKRKKVNVYTYKSDVPLNGL